MPISDIERLLQLPPSAQRTSPLNKLKNNSVHSSFYNQCNWVMYKLYDACIFLPLVDIRPYVCVACRTWEERTIFSTEPPGRFFEGRLWYCIYIYSTAEKRESRRREGYLQDTFLRRWGNISPSLKIT